MLEIVQERADQRCVEIFEIELGGLLADSLGGEAKQQPHRGAVGGDRVLAGVLLTDEPLGEERLQGGCERS